MSDEPAPQTSEVAGEPLGRLGRVMARNMAASVAENALSRIGRDIDLTDVVIDRGASPIRYSINTYVLAAVARSLPAHPRINGHLDGKTIVVPKTVNLGVAVSVDDGLIVPVVQDAQRLSVGDLDAAVAELAAKARAGQLKLPDVEGATFTVSNLGMFGVDDGFALPAPSQAAILLVGRGRERFEPDHDGQPVLRTVARFGLTFDHRFIDGVAAARLLADIAKALSRPNQLRDGGEQT